MKQRRQFKTGGVSQCWHSRKQLVRIKDGFIYATLEDPLGNKMRVHKDCVKLAIGHGIKETLDE